MEVASAKLQHLQDLNNSILDKTADADLETATTASDDYNSDIRQRLVIFERHLSRLSSKIGGDKETKLDASATPFEPTAIQTSYRNVQLPKLELAKFSGKVLEWQSFFDGFLAAVHNNKNLNDVQKLHYLRGQLSGEAARAIERLQLTEANYSNAIEILRDRYGQTHMVKAAYMKALWELPTPNGDLSSIREFNDSIGRNQACTANMWILQGRIAQLYQL